MGTYRSKVKNPLPVREARSRAAAEPEHQENVLQASFLPPVLGLLPLLLGPEGEEGTSEEVSPETLAETPESEEEKAARLKKYHKVKKTPQTMKGLDAELGKMVRLMLNKAGYAEPQKWFDEMVSVKFLGKNARKIRPEFADCLKDAEKKVCAKLALENPELDDPVKAGEYLGIDQGLVTFRDLRPETPEYQSMHLFGLAIDINAHDNPWISRTKTTHKHLKKVIGRMDELFNSSLAGDYSGAYTKPDTEIGSATRLGEIYDSYQSLDDKFALYFSLLNDDDALQKALDGTTSKTWKGKSASASREQILKAAKKKIQADLTQMSKDWSRKGKNNRKNLQKEGIMDLDKRLVMAMGEAGLEWGGKFGDMMHFDMRFTGIGKDIQATKTKGDVSSLKKALIAEKAARAAEAAAAAEEAAAAEK